ncbi:ABC transporter permease [Ectothiorhodospiraceae bacterium BW-2]|nr:ABC transporter permease [Ectothiorhodospiraceae bacterium BW-2]
MSWRRFMALVRASTLEFVRDRAALGWNILFPVMIMLAFALLFSESEQALYKVGMVGEVPVDHPFLAQRYIDFLPEEGVAEAVVKVERHQLDMVIDWQLRRYWVNESSPNGYIVEQLLYAAAGDSILQRQPVSGRAERYIDWLVVGLLGMNAMFNALYGIGFVIVRYRKNGVLKRLRATPLTVAEFLGAQIVSRILLILGVTSLVYWGCDLLLNFTMHGSYLTLLLVLFCGALAMIAMGLLIASRLYNEELAGGLANGIAWPMMLLSGVWFSLEGSPVWVMTLAQLLPLTHAIEAGRAVMLRGAGVIDIAPQLGALLLMTLLFLAIGVKLFRWQSC